ncbi:MAG: tRNA epoxyqueuosine(34) reductase QueG [Prevotella sp.]|uniref:tRNA epoxyqueuosine(34) reductase QueG n=1 Tax=Prevotella sp. TaxID=59823 RepID=UPI002A28B9FC|nr:tRNA epoxyqueuosine(34) reductase QueG [Prevotella sp.]MDD7318242.1 tRNA epoxyqueuosine(34) reductase QueG [Prevotellaceae bacterium]MDY4020869.1 tRNA epoxyqueuosine(34) reductase QueG [Prevotella sp.]
MSSALSNRIKAEAASLGFSACGIARAEAVSNDAAERFMSWLDYGGHATMTYMENHLEKRLDPRLLVPGTRSIVSVALNYAPANRLPEDEYQIAAYALGQDYHDIVKGKLRELVARIFEEPSSCTSPTPPLDKDSFRVFSDSAPVLERYWAVKAGLGWIGRNHQLIIPRAGSMFFLGEVFLPIELEYDSPMKSRCGNCRKCIDACPTKALVMGEEGSEQCEFLSSKCLSYLTIENRGDIPDDMAAAMGNTIYGCDRCQQACPWNRYAHPTDEPSLQPKEELMDMTREKWQSLSEEDFRRLFKGSAVKRAKYEGLMRNINKVKSL